VVVSFEVPPLKIQSDRFLAGFPLFEPVIDASR
jgi:hypothetical protein